MEVSTLLSNSSSLYLNPIDLTCDNWTEVVRHRTSVQGFTVARKENNVIKRVNALNLKEFMFIKSNICCEITIGWSDINNHLFLSTSDSAISHKCLNLDSGGMASNVFFLAMRTQLWTRYPWRKNTPEMSLTPKPIALLPIFLSAISTSLIDGIDPLVDCLAILSGQIFGIRTRQVSVFNANHRFLCHLLPFESVLSLVKYPFITISQPFISLSPLPSRLRAGRVETTSRRRSPVGPVLKANSHSLYSCDSSYDTYVPKQSTRLYGPHIAKGQTYSSPYAQKARQPFRHIDGTDSDVDYKSVFSRGFDLSFYQDFYSTIATFSFRWLSIPHISSFFSEIFDFKSIESLLLLIVICFADIEFGNFLMASLVSFIISEVMIVWLTTGGSTLVGSEDLSNAFSFVSLDVFSNIIDPSTVNDVSMLSVKTLGKLPDFSNLGLSMDSLREFGSLLPEVVLSAILGVLDLLSPASELDITFASLLSLLALFLSILLISSDTSETVDNSPDIFLRTIKSPPLTSSITSSLSSLCSSDSTRFRQTNYKKAVLTSQQLSTYRWISPEQELHRRRLRSQSPRYYVQCCYVSIPLTLEIPFVPSELLALFSTLGGELNRLPDEAVSKDVCPEALSLSI
ncbi:unnamed protein product [Medioppia subpectinata]|uniref:Uncharacterized protein n=1 Tax=Medioppia subpectinata TaxID=1979941 RepID=A0A7R9KC97_9ACAR|nr:unnamed protein product [Medioppia subpectinata]CAG2100747.1 unnamed protein product [Medioppia subpectinata]